MIFLDLIDLIKSLANAGGFGTLVVALGVALLFYGVGNLLERISRRLAERRANRPPLSEAEQAAEAKLAAKKLNEHIKLFASLCNTLGAAVLGSAFLVPYIKEHGALESNNLLWVGVGLALPLAGQWSLRAMRSEG